MHEIITENLGINNITSEQIEIPQQNQPDIPPNNEEGGTEEQEKEGQRSQGQNDEVVMNIQAQGVHSDDIVEQMGGDVPVSDSDNVNGDQLIPPRMRHTFADTLNPRPNSVQSCPLDNISSPLEDSELQSTSQQTTAGQQKLNKSRSERRFLSCPPHSNSSRDLMHSLEDRAIIRQKTNNLSDKQPEHNPAEENPEKGPAQHASVYAIDPMTNKRFYEPHKRPGCTDIYCLSRVTQIGERICNIENKFVQLQELFNLLIGSEGGGMTGAIDASKGAPALASQPLPLSSIAQRASTVQQNTYRAAGTGQRSKNVPLPARILAPLSMPTGQKYASPSPAPHPAQSQPQQMSLSLPMSINTRLGKKPIPVSFKPLLHGIRVYFLAPSLRPKNCCPVCFATFMDAVGVESHKNTHLIEPLDPYVCLVCWEGGPQYRIQFLSLPAIVQHLLNQHGLFTGTTKCYAKAPITYNHHRLELIRFVQDQLGVLPQQRKPDRMAVGGQKPVAIQPDQQRQGQTEKRKCPIGSEDKEQNAQKSKKRKPVRDLPSPVVFDLKGDDCLDVLLGDQPPHTLLERFRRLKTLARTPMNKLVISAIDFVAEKDFNLANIIAGVESLDEVVNSCGQKDNQDNLKEAGHSRSLARSSLTEEGQVTSRDQKNESGDEFIDVDQISFSSSSEEEREEEMDEEEQSDEDPDWRSAYNDEVNCWQKKNRLRTSKISRARALPGASESHPLVSTGLVADSSPRQTTGPHIQSYRVVSSQGGSAAQTITPSSALMKQFGYVASKGLYAPQVALTNLKDDRVPAVVLDDDAFSDD